MKPRMLERMHQALMDNPGVSFAFSSFYYGAKLFKLFPYNEQRLKQMPYIHTTSLIRREDFCGFDNAIRRFQDWDVWLTMLAHSKKGVWIDEPLFTTQLGRGHISQWLPKAAYKWFPFLKAVKNYNQSMAIIKRKHKLK